MKRFFFLWFLFFSGIVLAGNVSEDQARQIAVSFWQSAPVTRGGIPSLQMVFHSEDPMFSTIPEALVLSLWRVTM